jgi:hypothetical protein
MILAAEEVWELELGLDRNLWSCSLDLCATFLVPDFEQR